MPTTTLSCLAALPCLPCLPSSPACLPAAPLPPPAPPPFCVIAPPSLRRERFSDLAALFPQVGICLPACCC